MANRVLDTQRAASGNRILDAQISSGSTVISVSSATTDGADVSAANLSVIVGTSSATTDGADTSAGNVSVLVALSSATTDGADTVVANVYPLNTISFSSAVTDGADSLSGIIGTPGVNNGSGGGYDYGHKSTPRYTYIDTSSDEVKKELPKQRKKLVEVQTKPIPKVDPVKILAEANLDEFANKIDLSSYLLSIQKDALDAEEDELLLMLMACV